MKLSVSERPSEVLGLMERALRGGRPLASEYPLVFGESGLGRFVVAGEHGRVDSTCALLEREVVMPGGRLRVGLIGAVSTDEAQRGRGLASAVLQRAESELAARGCAFSMLWADDASFYLRRGYQEIGAELDYALPVELAEALPRTDDVRPATPHDFARLHRLYRGHERRVERSAVESELLLATPGMRVLVHESGNELDAYACYERGGDLTNVLHEWAGEPRGVLACARIWLEELASTRTEQALFLMAPAPAGALGELLDGLGVPSARGILGMAKLLDPERLLDELCAGASQPLTFRERPAGRWEVRGPGGSVELAREQLLSLVFAPRAERTELEGLELVLGVDLPGLPRTPFLWGLDSI